MGTGSRVPLEVDPGAYNSGVDEEKLYSDVIQNLRRAPQAENQDEADNDVRVDDDAVGADEDLATVEWDPLNPHMKEGQIGNIQQYVHDYYSVARFKSTYVYALPAMKGKQQWDIVDPGFKLCALVLKRAAGRPRKSRIRPRSEGAGLGARKRNCTRCGGHGHLPVAATDDENDGQQSVASDEDLTSEAPNGDPSEAPNGDPSKAPNDDPSEARNGDQPSIVLYGRFEEDAQGTDNQEEKRTSNGHNEQKVHEEQSDGKKLKDQTKAPTLFMNNYETI
ncbi:hypothetical protein D1007_51665 [Hordeum vulgare]|nr:hypothetical protein D1007_51665 [Hordeum vulgare]